MDRQRTTRIQRTAGGAHNGTGYGPLQPHSANQDRNQPIKICLFRYSVATMQRQKMETSVRLIKDYTRRRMQLQYSR